jgi:hypothetical protein
MGRRAIAKWYQIPRFPQLGSFGTRNIIEIVMVIYVDECLNPKLIMLKERIFDQKKMFFVVLIYSWLIS